MKISGNFPQIYFSDFYRHEIGPRDSDAKKLLSVEQWGTRPWKSMEQAFYWCENLEINAVDSPDLSQVKSTKYMFAHAKSFNQDIADWDFSAVVDMSHMFEGASKFNQDIAKWDVSSVTNLSFMFSAASSFNQKLNDWNVSSVTDMSHMFYKAIKFNQELGDWDTSSLIYARGMFRKAEEFNQYSINGWNVSKVVDMSYMFNGASSFNQSLTGWDVSSVRDMFMFLTKAGISDYNYSFTLRSWSFLDLQKNVDLHVGGLNYVLEYRDYRNRIIGDFNWEIYDGGWVVYE